MKQETRFEAENDLNMHDLRTAEKIIDYASRRQNLVFNYLRYHTKPLERLNGDLILAEVSPCKRRIILLADFTGHGMEAAISAMTVPGLFYNMVSKSCSLEEIVNVLNDKLYSILPTEKFMAVCILEIDVARKCINIINAGLPDIYFINDNANIKHKIKSKNIPLGIMSSQDSSFNFEIHDIQSNDRIYMHTDGLTDVFNEKEQVYGEERFENFILTCRSLDNLFDGLLLNLHEYMGGISQTDDKTLVEVSCA